MRSLLLVMLLLAGAEAEAAPKVTMYGAAWCGPCKTVKAFLSQNRVSYAYVDIDTADGRKRYVEARGSYKGIPLTVIGRQKVRGANLKSLVAALQRERLMKEASIAEGSDTYGGHSAAWWQAQFRNLRAQLARMDTAIAAKEKVAADHYEKELLAKMKEDREIISQSIDQLEIDASNVSLPRKYRR